MRWWAITAMLGLAGLDLTGALLAKELAARPRLWMYALAIAMWVLVFVVYVWSIRYEDLWLITFGWITMLQVGVLLLDRFRFGTEVSGRRWLLAALLIVVQVAILLPDHHGGDAAAGQVVVEAIPYR